MLERSTGTRFDSWDGEVDDSPSTAASQSRCRWNDRRHREAGRYLCDLTLEIVADANTVTPMGPDVPIRVKVLFQGRPLKEARVSFIPRGVTLADGFDSTHERQTNENGRCFFTPKEGNYYLVVVHHQTDEKGDGYDSTSYSATLTVFVPDVYPCCGE